MFSTLHQLIAEKKAFDGFRETLEKRCVASKLSCAIKYGDTPPNSSLFVRFESEKELAKFARGSRVIVRCSLPSLKKKESEMSIVGLPEARIFKDASRKSFVL